MAEIIKSYYNGNRPIVDTGHGVLPHTYFNLLKLNKGELAELEVAGYETVYVVLSGNCDIEAAGCRFSGVGRRENIWSGAADSVYVTSGARTMVRSNADGTEIAVAGGRYDKRLPPFRILPEETVEVVVGSNETKSRRRIVHILGTNTKGRTGNLLVSELYADEGCWAGYPPHKHDEERYPEETAFEELYYNRFQPENGFGVQIVFHDDETSQCFLVRHGDTCLIDGGYHPMATSPGHAQYVFTILVGKHRNSLIQYFHEDYRRLMDVIPGLSDMRAKFR